MSKRVFIAHAPGDRPLVPLLAELLTLHNHQPAYAAFDADEGTADARINTAVVTADVMIAVVSKRSKGSAWMEREISVFQAVRGNKSIIPILLERADIQDVRPELAGFKSVDFSTCMLTGFQRLFAVLGNEFLSRSELSDRRATAGRRVGDDRRRAGSKQRLFVGFMLTYCRETGHDALDTLSLEADELSAMRDAIVDEARKYLYVDKESERTVSPDEALYCAIEALQGKVGTARREDVARIFQLLADGMVELYHVSMQDRRLQDDRRDSAEDPGADESASS